MKDQNTQADNVTMSGGGLYSLATRGAKDVIDIATPRVLAALDELGFDSSSERFTLAVYDRDKCIQILVAQGMSDIDAEDHFSYNVEGAYVGPGTPCFARLGAQ